jgi:hypothetical protein
VAGAYAAANNDYNLGLWDACYNTCGEGDAADAKFTACSKDFSLQVGIIIDTLGYIDDILANY